MPGTQYVRQSGVRRQSAIAGEAYDPAPHNGTTGDDVALLGVLDSSDAAPVYRAVLDDLMPAAWHHNEQYANNPIEADHGQLKRRRRRRADS